MGVYIPPPSEGGNAGGNAGGSSGKGSGVGGSGGGAVITIPNPASYIPRNPSIGLKLFGPLVPASDNVSGLYFLTALQFTFGLVAYTRARQLRKANLARLGIANTFKRRMTKYACVVGGLYLIFQSGLELTRLLLPYDPWQEEARFYRRVATKNGDNPSWWFGATGYYKPMSFQEWNQKVEAWIKTTANSLEHEDLAAKVPAAAEASSRLLATLAQKGRYGEIHQQLRETNEHRFAALLAHDLNEVNELNKAARIDLILEGKGPVQVNANYTKPPIQLGNHSVDSDNEFEVAWLNFEPWDELKLETEYDIRLVPRWNWPDEPEPTADEPDKAAT